MQKCDLCKAVALYEIITNIDGRRVTCKVCERHKAHIKTLYNECKCVSTLPIAVEFKTCALCGVTKPISDFYSYADHRGVPRLRTECKECNLKERKSLTFRKK